MPQLRDAQGNVLATSTAPITYAEEGGGWIVGDTLIADPTRAFTVINPGRYTPPSFKLLFSPAERIAIRTARAYAGADPAQLEVKAVLDDWFDILDDPRLTEVDLALPSTIAGVQYLALIGLITTERANAILSA